MRYAALLDREALVMTFNDQFLLVVISLSAFAMLLLRPLPQMGEAPPAKLDDAATSPLTDRRRAPL